ncbi:hypothetical protein JCM10213_006049 [Rhodosporidiobolus nylandii]
MTDYLTSLPAELLHDITEQVHESYMGPYLGRVAKAFLPHSRTLAFRKLKLYGSAGVLKFAALLKASPGVATYVETLESRFAQQYWQDEGKPSTKAVLALLSRLTSLKELSIPHSTRLVKAVLTDMSTTRLFPSLWRLELQDPFTGWANPFDPAHFRALSRHKELWHLTLNVERTMDSLGRYRPAKSSEILRSEWQWSLIIRGPLTKNPAAEDLLDIFPEIRSLIIHDTGPSAREHLPSFLACLPVPEVLRTLSFSCALDESTYPSLAASIQTFTRLSALEFCQNSFSPSLLPALLALPQLDELFFQQGTSVSSQDLVGLISGPDQLGKLKKVVINQIRFPDSWLGVQDEEPLWTKNFSREGMDEVLDAAQARHVKVVGAAADWVREERDREAAIAAAAANERGKSEG